MKGYGLHHALTNGDDMPSFIDAVLGNNGALVSTVEKMRAGIPVGGMSPSADMGTGGGELCVHPYPQAPDRRALKDRQGLYFKKRLLRRQDAISYNHDAFGKVRDGYVSSNRGSTPAEWKRFARSSGNETILKHSITLLDNIEVIVVGSERERLRLLDVFKRRQVFELPDGRKVEDIVLVR